MYKEIELILKHFLQNNTEDSEDRKHITVQLIEDEFKSGQIQIDFIGSWIKHFCIHNFKYTVWNKSSTDLLIHFGDNKEKSYHMYSLNYNKQQKLMSLTIEDEPFIEDCNNYLSFVMNVNCRHLQDILVNVKILVKKLAATYPDVRLSFSVSETLWIERDLNEKYLRTISEAVGEVMKYSTTFQNKSAHLLKMSNRADTTDKVYDKLSRILSKTYVTRQGTNEI